MLIYACFKHAEACFEHAEAKSRYRESILEPKGSFWELLGCLRVPRGRLGEALGSSRTALWSALWCFRGVSGRLWGAFVSFEGASPAEKVKMLDLLYLSSENKLFEVPEARK